MADIFDLLTTVNDPSNHEERDKMFDYLHKQKVIGCGLTLGQARYTFEQDMKNPDEAEDLALVYLPHYNTQNVPASRLRRTGGNSLQRTYVNQTLGKSATALVLGLGTIAISQGIMDEGGLQHLMTGVGAVTALGGVAGGLVGILKGN